MFLAHSTALNSSLAASSHIFSIPMMFPDDVGGSIEDCGGPDELDTAQCPLVEYRLIAGGYGSARSNMETKLDKYGDGPVPW